MQKISQEQWGKQRLEKKEQGRRKDKAKEEEEEEKGGRRQDEKNLDKEFFILKVRERTKNND